MEFREITTFIQVAKLHSFSKAADQLGYSQAAVTIQIKQLEKELNTRLFDRIGKKTSLTHQGKVFFEYAIAIMKEIEEAREAVSNPKLLNGTLCLGTIESICSTILPSLLKTYHERYPDVNVSIITGSPDDLLDQMDRNQIDIVYFLDKPIYNPKWIKIMELPEDIVFVASKQNPLADKDQLLLTELLTQPFILTEKNASYRFMLDQYLAAQEMEIRPFLEIGNTQFIISLLRSNLGVSLLPEFIIKKDLQSSDLAALKVKDFYMRTWLQIVYHKDKWVTKEMQAFIELAKLQMDPT